MCYRLDGTQTVQSTDVPRYIHRESRLYRCSKITNTVWVLLKLDECSVLPWNVCIKWKYAHTRLVLIQKQLVVNGWIFSSVVFRLLLIVTLQNQSVVMALGSVSAR